MKLDLTNMYGRNILTENFYLNNSMLSVLYVKYINFTSHFNKNHESVLTG